MGEVFVVPILWHVVAFAPFGVAVAVSDWRDFLIPDRLVVAGAVAVVIARVVWPAGTWWAALGGVAAACGLFWLARVISGGKMGWGDVKLAGLIALALGGPGWIGAMIAACAAALVWVFFFQSAVARDARVPFGSFMVVGAIVAGVVLAVVPLDGGYVV